MLSNKLTFSLVFVLALALVAGPAFAQVLTPDLNDTAIPEKSFIVYEAADDATTTGVHNGIVNITPIALGTLVGANATFPNLEEFLRFGGTIELLLNVGDPTAAGAAQTNTIVSDGTDAAGITADEAKKFSHRLVISEIMWGLDGTNTESQWIEIYNAGNTLFDADLVHLRFHPNTRVDNLGKKMTYDAAATTANAANPTGTWVVVDRVSTTNIRGGSWTLRGQSGRTTATDTQPVKNLASMYRKRSLSADGMMYKYDDNDNPTGDVFKDGMDGGQWIASTGRVNMEGPYIGTPGDEHRLVGGGAAVAASPASLPVGTVIINEIYNGDDFQWIELHNNGSAAVNVKKWEMEAAYGDKKLDRVFAIPDKDTNIPAGGFLVITNRDPSETILAGGVDLHDSNKFPAGASQLYIVIEKAGDNKWMPDKGFLLVLRNGNDKNNHEKIVDIAGNAFVPDTDPAIATSVWPLKGWAIPGDRHDNSFGNAANSLMRTTGKTYGRQEQKSRANRLHKDDWQDNGFGVVGGLGYDPGVDLAIAPGTPGYANNAQKANPADIMGEVVISEIMYDAGANGNLVQWIELYNSSMTQSALLNGDWELEIRNIDTDVESYVDAKFDFKNAVILPNQTLLLVSDRSSASDVPSNRVYNLYQQHRNELGLSARKSILLSSVGFHLELRYKTTVVDEVGNVMLDGPRRKVDWNLEELKGWSGGSRQSIVRGFGTRDLDGTADDADDGTMMSSWFVAGSVGSYYGHRDDVGSPGHREGSPLPVSLSSFRPVRDKATGEVVIRWVTESELNNAGFNILRSETKTGEFTVVNVKGLIAGHGTTSEKHTYEWKDTTAKPNVVYYYQIEDVSLDGNRTTLATTHLRGNVNAAGKLTTTWGDLKTQ